MSREDRLKAALRDNLKRRKLQARARAQTSDEAGEPKPEADHDRRPDAERERG